MGREASFELDCSEFSGSVTDFIKLLHSIGWSYYDGDYHAEYLPVGDSDSFDWQMEEITESSLYGVFDRKLQREETVGLVMYYRDTEYGITLLASDTSEIILIPNINRRTLTEGDEDSVTDVNWYAERILQKLLWYDCGLVGFRFEESGGQSDDSDDCEDFEEDEEDDDTGDSDDCEELEENETND